MAKKLRKREKLDLILSELAQLRADVAKLLLKRKSEGADPTTKRRSVRRKTVKARARPKPPAKPVLVEMPPAEHTQAAGRNG